MGMPIRWGGSDCFTHMLVVGPTRSGKTATILKPIIYQLLLMKKRGIPLGLSVVEPKGDVARMVAEVAAEMDLPYTHIDPMIDNTAKFNPMEGEINAVAEATVIVLKGLFGKQDAFFATVQELSARNVTKLLKELHGDQMDIIDVMNTLRDENVLQEKVAQLKRRDGMTDLVHFFESELLGSMKEKYRQFVIGLRAQLENIVSNDALRNIMTGKSSINIDEHFETGGILAVNTALGMLRSSGDAFGQFVIMHLQNGTFRRPGTEDTRVPHFLIVDEYSRYINPDVEIFLSLAAEYRVAGIFATQSLGQLEIESGKISAKAMKRSIMASCRNKIAFGGVTMEDAKDFAEEFGKDKIIMRQSTYKNHIFLPNLFPDSYRDTEEEEYRFDPTDIHDGLPRFAYIHQLMQGGALQKPGIAEGTFVPRNWKELREWEDKKEFGFIHRFKTAFKKQNQNKEEEKEPIQQVDELDEMEIKRLEEEAEKEAQLLEESERGKAKEQNAYYMERKMLFEGADQEDAGEANAPVENEKTNSDPADDPLDELSLISLREEVGVKKADPSIKPVEIKVEDKQDEPRSKTKEVSNVRPMTPRNQQHVTKQADIQKPKQPKPKKPTQMVKSHDGFWE